MNQPQRSPSGSLGGATSPRVATQVETLISELTVEIDNLEKAFGSHVAKIESVLRQEACVDAKECQPPEEMLVPVADRIRSQAKRIMLIRRGLENVTQRTEA